METLSDLIQTNNNNIPIVGFIVNFLIAFLFSSILGYIYKTFGTSISDKTSFAKNFVLITTTTMLIISIIKSSLALSLGLVGALSIIRFRTAIKEPEELMYLFLAISVGLGLGANQTYITTIAFILILVFIICSFYLAEFKISEKSMYLTIEFDSGENIEIRKIKRLISDNCTSVNLRKYERSEDNIELLFIVTLIETNSMDIIDKEIAMLDQNAKISFLDYNLSII